MWTWRGVMSGFSSPLCLFRAKLERFSVPSSLPSLMTETEAPYYTELGSNSFKNSLFSFISTCLKVWWQHCWLNQTSLAVVLILWYGSLHSSNILCLLDFFFLLLLIGQLRRIRKCWEWEWKEPWNKEFWVAEAATTTRRSVLCTWGTHLNCLVSQQVCYTTLFKNAA